MARSLTSIADSEKVQALPTGRIRDKEERIGDEQRRLAHHGRDIVDSPRGKCLRLNDIVLGVVRHHGPL
jgi:hypothetical protein